MSHFVSEFRRRFTEIYGFQTKATTNTERLSALLIEIKSTVKLSNVVFLRID
jgi:hypothetical protein